MSTEWHEQRLGDVVTLQRGFDLPHRQRERGDFPIVTSSGIEDSHCEAKVKAPGVVTGRYGTIGKVFFVESDFWPLNTTLYVRDFHGNDPLFISYLLRTIDFETHSGKSGVPGVNRNDLHEETVVVPPTLTEQQSIANALDDADALIESLEQLVAKKRHLKQAAMQQLLQKKCSDRVKILGVVSTLKGRIGWQGLNQTEFTTNAEEPFLITGMNFKDGAIRWDEVYHVSKERYKIAKEIQLRIGDVLMTKDGTIGKMLFVDSIPYPKKATLNSHLLLFRPINYSYVPKYLYYQLCSKRFQDFIDLNKSGTTFFGISQESVSKYPMILPTIEEQQRIAEILSDMDTEIEAIYAKLTKARQIKQGMMQELLTGRTRLV